MQQILASQHLQRVLSLGCTGRLPGLWRLVNEHILLLGRVQSLHTAGTLTGVQVEGRDFTQSCSQHGSKGSAARPSVLLRQEHGLAIWQTTAAHLD